VICRALVCLRVVWCFRGFSRILEFCVILGLVLFCVVLGDLTYFGVFCLFLGIFGDSCIVWGVCDDFGCVVGVFVGNLRILWFLMSLV